MKICSKCKQSLPYEAFNISRQKKDGLQSYCRECWKIAYKDTYYRNGHEQERLAKKRAELRSAAAEYIRKAKDIPCTDCGIKYPYYVMQFDHLDPNMKSFGLGGGQVRSLAQIKREIAKCEVVCANCHMERTHGKEKDV